jgi:hypothetical protein
LLRGLAVFFLMASTGLIAAPAMAQGETLTVSVDRKTLNVGERIKLTVRSRTESASRGNLQSPSLADWQIVGQFEHTSFDSTRSARVRTLNLTLQPLKTGTIVIEAFVLQTATGPQRSKPITITVGGTTPAPSAASDAPASNAETAPDKAAFVRWETPNKGPMWLGAQFQARLVFYYNVQVRLRRAEMGDLKIQGFWTHDRKARSDRHRVQIGDQIFERETLLHYQLVPLRAGTLELPAVSVEMTADQSRGFDRRRVTVDRVSPTVPIVVKPLPQAGRPAGFDGATVGTLKLEAAADRTKVSASEGVQFTLITTVDGMLQNVPKVELSGVDGFRVFPPSGQETVRLFNDSLRGVRRQSWLMRPTRNGELTIPSLSIAYFDPASGRYKTAKSRPIRIKATGIESDRKAGANGATILATDTLALRSIRKQIDPTTADRAIYLQPWFLLGALAPPLAFLGLLLLGRLRRKRDAQAPQRSAKRAQGVARARLAAIARGKVDAPYAAVSHALMDFLESRIGQPVNGLTHGALTQLLQAKGATQTQTGALVAELENCDYARFAPSGGLAGVEECVARACALVDELEGALR